MPRYPVAEMVVKQLDLKPGETLTVWLRNGETRASLQVELRVHPDGYPEVFCKDRGVLMDFDDWYPLPGKGPRP